MEGSGFVAGDRHQKRRHISDTDARYRDRCPKSTYCCRKPDGKEKQVEIYMGQGGYQNDPAAPRVLATLAQPQV